MDHDDSHDTNFFFVCDNVRHMKHIIADFELENINGKCFILQPRSHVIYSDLEDKEQLATYMQN